MPKTARSRPSGKGGAIGFPSTKCFAGTGMRCARPGSASSRVGMRSLLEKNAMLVSSFAPA
jgi:hypothetical protein